MKGILKLTVFLLFIGIAPAQKTKNTQVWDTIGSDKVGHSVEKKSFKVDKDKDFKMIKIRVFKSGLLIERWVLEYTNGLFQHVGFVGFVPANKNYPPVQVNGKLKKIHFRYQSIQDKEKAQIEVLGKE